ncbi:MAG: glycosyltransferase family 4 protein [Acidobacteriota bacterium]
MTTQSEILARLFADAGYSVRATSSLRSPLLRPLAMAARLAAWRRSIDLVVLSVFSGRAFAVADLVSRVARGLGLPQVQVLRGGAFPELVAERPDWARAVLARADAVVAPSGFLARDAEALSLDERGVETTVIPNVVDLGRIDHRPRQALPPAPKLLWMRTFHPIYHPRLAVEVLAALRRAGLAATLTMAGQDKGLEAACRERAAELGLGDVVAFPGFLDIEAKRRALDAHDVFLNTNRVDNTPVTVIEACAAGLPVVATAVGGLPDLLDDEVSGLLVAEEVDAMAGAVRRLVAEPALVARLSRGARAVAEECDWPHVHERWRDLFERVAARSETRRAGRAGSAS